MENYIYILSQAWKKAGNELGFEVEAPYCAKTFDGIEVICIAHLPDYGSSNGMVIGALIGPNYTIDHSVKQVAKESKKYCSFINLKVYENYDREIFKEALSDWGFWGVETKRPKWLQKK